MRNSKIITELSMPVEDAFDALLIMNLGRLPSRAASSAVPLRSAWLGCIAGTLILVLTFSLTRCNGRCLTTPKLRLRDAAKWVTRYA